VIGKFLMLADFTITTLQTEPIRAAKSSYARGQLSGYSSYGPGERKRPGILPGSKDKLNLENYLDKLAQETLMS